VGEIADFAFLQTGSKKRHRKIALLDIMQHPGLQSNVFPNETS
jgi:hypothetical protein